MVERLTPYRFASHIREVSGTFNSLRISIT
jgi:hypothetical protein